MTGKLIGLLLIGALLLSACIPAEAAPKSVIAEGVDVSEFQGKIDWETLANHVDFVIIRCGFGQDRESQDDAYWYRNVEACTRLGIPFGVYLYSYATTEKAARSELSHALRLLKGYEPSLPVFIDVEDATIANTCSNAEVLNHVRIFCEGIAAAGYTPGVYTNAEFWNHRMPSDEYCKWERWVAQWDSPLHDDRPYCALQYTNEGKVPGIDGYVDRNYWYGLQITSECTHEYTCEITKEATCTDNGIKKYDCFLCGNSYEETVPAKGHSFTETIIPPTETQGGVTLYECACGYSYTDGKTPCLSHISDSGTITKTPTETEGGERTYSCKNCGFYLGREDLPSVAEHRAHCASSGFTDVPPYLHWAHEGIDAGLCSGLFLGVDETHFEPDTAMTRAMTVTVLWRFYDCPAAAKPCNFSDVPQDAWYAGAVAWAQECGLVNGIGNGKFDPMGEITREQLVTILYRSECLDSENTVPEGALEAFPDKNSVSDYAREAMTWAVCRNFLIGTKEKNGVYLNPGEVATRAQAATIIERFS